MQTLRGAARPTIGTLRNARDGGGHEKALLRRCPFCCHRAQIGGYFGDTELRGLTSTHPRPADILTNAAVRGRSAALDVCVVSPNAAAAQSVAAESAFRRKLRRYRDPIHELARAGIAFRSLPPPPVCVWTADGIPHPAATRTLRYAAELVSSRHGGLPEVPAILRRWKQDITVTIMRRLAVMARAVIPGPTAHADWLLTGVSSGMATSAHRELPVDADGNADDAVVQGDLIESNMDD